MLTRRVRERVRGNTGAQNDHQERETPGANRGGVCGGVEVVMGNQEELMEKGER